MNDNEGSAADPSFTVSCSLSLISTARSESIINCKLPTPSWVILPTVLLTSSLILVVLAPTLRPLLLLTSSVPVVVSFSSLRRKLAESMLSNSWLLAAVLFNMKSDMLERFNPVLMLVNPVIAAKGMYSESLLKIAIG